MGKPWFKFFSSDWITGVSILKDSERGVYITLIAMMYERESPIKRDDERLARACGSPTQSALTKSLEALIRLGKIIEKDGALYNVRALGEMEDVADKIDGCGVGADHKWLRNHKRQRDRSARLSAARRLGTHTKQEWAAMLTLFPRCLSCGEDGQMVKDHIKPLYQGGDDSIDNLQPLCQPCNSSKGPGDDDLRPDGWREKFYSLINDATPTKRPQNAIVTPIETAGTRAHARYQNKNIESTSSTRPRSLSAEALSSILKKGTV